MAGKPDLTLPRCGKKKQALKNMTEPAKGENGRGQERTRLKTAVKAKEPRKHAGGRLRSQGEVQTEVVGRTRKNEQA